MMAAGLRPGRIGATFVDPALAGLAIALAISGWLVFGVLGQERAPGQAVAWLPLALWAGLSGLARPLRGGRPFRVASGRALRLALGIGLALTLACSDRSLPALCLAALFWAPLPAALMAASSTRAHRGPARARAGGAWWMAGAWLGAIVVALLLAGDARLGDALRDVAIGLGLAGAGLPASRPLAAGSGSGLRAAPSTPTCAIGLATNGPPDRLAGLAMAVMMTTFALSLDWCRASGLGPSVVIAMHWAAMLLPAAILAGHRSPRQGLPVDALLVLAGIFAFGGGPHALAGSMVLASCAWSLGCAGARPAGPAPGRHRSGRATATGIIVTIAGVIGIGALGTAIGPLLPALALGGTGGLALVRRLRPWVAARCRRRRFLRRRSSSGRMQPSAPTSDTSASARRPGRRRGDAHRRSRDEWPSTTSRPSSAS